MVDPRDEHIRPDRAAAAASGADVFAERLLQIIDEGQRTATYKLALVLALIDASAAHAANDGRAPEVLHTRDVAAHVLRLYLPQTRRYLAGSDEAQVLRQITSGNSAILGAVTRLYGATEVRGCRLSEIATRLPDEYEACLDEVERTVARYPLRLLQVVGREHRPFLYDIDWSASVGLRTLHAPGGGQVRFRPGAGDHLLRLAPLVRPLVELHWTRMVARLNRLDLEEERLRAHLTGHSAATGGHEPQRSGTRRRGLVSASPRRAGGTPHRPGRSSRPLPRLGPEDELVSGVVGRLGAPAGWPPASQRGLSDRAHAEVYAAVRTAQPVTTTFNGLYASEWGVRVRRRGGFGRAGQVTPPAWRSTRSR